MDNTTTEKQSPDLRDMTKRYTLFLIGLFIASMGVAFSAKAGLGTSPVASVPYSVSLVSSLLSFGGWLNLLSVIQIITQVVILKGKVNYIEIAVQTILAFVYGYLTDFSCWLISGIEVTAYPMQFAFMLLGCVILAFGIWIQFKGGVAMLPGEAMNRAISKVTGRRYENIKIFFDIFYIALSAVICLIFLGELKGVREGSIIAAVLVGTVIKGYNRLFDRLRRKKMNLNSLTDKLFPAVTSDMQKCGGICFYAQSDITCYVIKGTGGDLLIDTGMPQVWYGLSRWLENFDIRYVLLTHAHADHDWNAAKLQKSGAEILLCERDKTLRRNFMSQKVKPTLPKYRFRNYTQWINGSLFRSPPYDADIYFSAKDKELLRRRGFDGDIIPLPGHTLGSVGVLSGDVLYCGDAFTALWKRPDITPHAVSPKLMKRSLERIVKLSPKWLACGHGLPVRFDKALPVIGKYLRTH